MRIEILTDAHAVARKAAEIITPWQMLRALTNEDVPWEGVRVIQVDERVAPDGDADRNLTHLRESLLEHAPLRPDQIHGMPVQSAELGAGAERYAVTLQRKEERG